MNRNIVLKFITILATAGLPIQANAQSAQDLMNQALRQIIKVPSQNQTQPRTRTRAAPTGNPELAEIQRLLNAAGYSAGTPDGLMGPSTLQAITAYQTSIGSTPTGQLSQSDIQKLRSGAQTPTQESKPAQVDLAAVQSNLNTLGFDAGVVDGLWGRKSQSALDAFRAERGITRTGRPVAEDLAALTAPQPPEAPIVADTAPTTEAPIEAVQSQSPTGLTLASLPAVDKGSAFRIAWSGEPSPAYRLAIAPPGSDAGVAVKSWPLGPESPTIVEAPDEVGSYEIIFIDYATNSVLVRRGLEVR